MAKSIAGAFSGVLMGAAAWILLYQLGYISAIGGMLMSICGLKGYEYFSHSLTRRGIAITSVMSVVMLFLAELAAIALEIYRTGTGRGLADFGEAIVSVFFFLEDPQVVSAVLYDLFMGYVLMAIGIAVSLKKMRKKASDHSYPSA